MASNVEIVAGPDYRGILYDLSGRNAKFSIEDEFRVTKENQVITLKFPAYKEIPIVGEDRPANYFSVVVLADTGNGLSEQTLYEDNSPGLTFSIVETDYDAQVISDAIVASKFDSIPEYNPVVVNKMELHLIGPNEDDQFPVGSQLTVKVRYHRVSAHSLDIRTTGEVTGEYGGAGPSYSPALMQKVLQRINALESRKESKLSLFGTAMSSDEILDEDITGLAPENFVKYELHDINTSAGVSIIMPSRGSFYPKNFEVLVYEPTMFTLAFNTKNSAKGKLFIYSDTEDAINPGDHISTVHKVILEQTILDSLVGSTADNGKTYTGRIVDLMDTNIKRLKVGEDFVFDSVDIPRTSRSVSTDPVYQFIRFIKPRTGEVLISYQAFGGMVSADDIRNILQNVTNTREVIQNADLVTTDSLGGHTVLVELSRRLRSLEEYHRRYEQVEHNVNIKTTGVHWINIAAIYDVDYATASQRLHDIGQFHISSALRKWTYEFMVDVDLSRKGNNIFHVKMLGSNQSAGACYDDFIKKLFRDTVLTRVCWVGNGRDSGLVLQIGWSFDNYNEVMIDTDTIVVTNKSGSASMWRLLHDPDSLNYAAGGLVSVWNHTKYQPTTDTIYRTGKDYYLYTTRSVYVRSVDEQFVSGKSYFTYNDDEGSYIDVALLGNPQYYPGGDTSWLMTEDAGGNKILNLFENVVYGRFPIKLDPSTYTIGDPVSEGVYEVAPSTYTETSFSMPNTQFTWTEGDASSNSSVKILEPEDGVTAWLGFIGLKNTCTVSYGNCPECISTPNNDPTGPSDKGAVVPYETMLLFKKDIHKIIDLNNVKSATFTIFDKRDGVYITVDANLSHANGSAVCEFFYCIEDLCACRVEFSKKTNMDTTYTVESTDELIFAKIQSFTGTSSLKNNRFDFREISFHF